MKSPNRVVLMSVYNEIDYDGRVQRAAAALSSHFDVTVLSVDSGKGYQNGMFHTRVVKLPASRRPRVLALLYFWLAFLMHVLRMRPVVVYAHDFFMAFPGWVGARMVAAEFVYDAHELIIPEAGQAGTLRDRLFSYLERLVVRRAELVVAANAQRAEIMMKHYRLPTLPVMVHNMTPAPPQREGGPSINAQLPVRALGEVRLVYQGDISLERGLGSFVQALQHLGDHVTLWLIGSGPGVDQLRREAHQAGVGGRVHFVGRVPRDHLHDLMEGCDIGIITYPTTGLNNIYCAPNKIFEYAHAGLPVVSTCQPPLRAVLSQYEIGSLVGCHGAGGDLPREIATAIECVLANRDSYKANLRHVLRDYTWEQEAERLLLAVRSASHE